MNYGASIPAAYHQVGIYTRQKLKGANPAKLPIQRPTKLILVVNLKAAKALGASFPTHEYAGLELLPTTRTAVSESVITGRSNPTPVRPYEICAFPLVRVRAIS
jgi:ABC-type uncharacterized transport system substrate-binding protein